MPYIFRPEHVPAADNPAAGFLRRLLSARPVIITEQEWSTLSRRDQAYFSLIPERAAIEMTRRLLDVLMHERDGQPAVVERAQTDRALRAEAEAAQWAASAQEAARTVEMVQRTLGGPTPRQIRAAEEMAEVLNRRRRRPQFPGATTHSNEGDIEPEDL